jgi:hypothetical protein
LVTVLPHLDKTHSRSSLQSGIEFKFSYQLSRLAPRLPWAPKMANYLFTFLVTSFVVRDLKLFVEFIISFPCRWVWRAYLAYLAANLFQLQLSRYQIQIQTANCDQVALIDKLPWIFNGIHVFFSLS